MENTRPHCMLSQRFQVIALLALAALIGLCAAYVITTYRKHAEHIAGLEEGAAQKAEEVLNSSYLYTQSMMQHIGQEILRGDVKDYARVARILRLFRDDARAENLSTWSMFSFADADARVRATSTTGVLPEPITITFRPYVAPATETAWKLFVSPSAKGAISGLNILPAGLGVADAAGKPVGIVTIGFNIQSLTSLLDAAIDDSAMSYEIYDTAGKAIITRGEVAADAPLVMSDSGLSIRTRYHEAYVWHSIADDMLVVSAVVLLALLGAGYLYRQAKAHLLEPAVQSIQRAAKADREKEARDKFFAQMSHELRTPLNAILGFSEALGAGILGEMSAKQREYVHDIHHSGARLLSLVNEILDIAKIEAGKMDLHLQDVEVAGVVMEAVRGVSPLYKAKNLNVMTQIGDDLPCILADRKRVGQILTNLLSNAIKYTDHGGNIKITVDDAEGAVGVRISDSGCGMTPNELAIALDEYGAIDHGLGRDEQSTGLGLPLARKLTQLHGGQFDISSKKGKGTSVYLTFPLQGVFVEKGGLKLVVSN
jgi:signal transduction histidine kinase